MKMDDYYRYHELMSSHELNVLKCIYGFSFYHHSNFIKGWLYAQDKVTKKMKRKLDRLEKDKVIKFNDETFKYRFYFPLDDFPSNIFRVSVRVGNISSIYSFSLSLKKSNGWQSLVVDNATDIFKHEFGIYLRPETLIKKPLFIGADEL